MHERQALNRGIYKKTATDSLVEYLARAMYNKPIQCLRHKKINRGYWL